MQTLTQEDARKLKLLSATVKSFPHSKADGETLALYVQMLKPLSYAEVEAGICKLLRTAKFFPTIAEIFAAADELKAAAQGTEVLDAGAAWEEAMQNVKRNHVYKPWAYSRPEVEQAVKQFGKTELCELESDAVNTARAQFMRIYNAIVERGRSKEQNTAVLNQLGRAKIDALIGGTLKQIGG